MLEDLANSYLFRSEGNVDILYYGAFFIGTLGTWIFYKSAAELRRAPYFAITSILVLASAARGIIWVGSPSLIFEGFLWAILAIEMCIGLVIGIIYGSLSAARSRDAFGHGKMSFLALIPLGNLWLMLARSKLERSDNRVISHPLFTGSTGVGTGFALIFATVLLNGYIRDETDRVLAELENDPAYQPILIDWMLRAQGVEGVLDQMAAESVSVPIDPNTTLSDVVSDGTTLRFLYEISADVEEVPAGLGQNAVENGCGSIQLRPLFEAGAVFEHIYRTADGDQIGMETVDGVTCDF